MAEKALANGEKAVATLRKPAAISDLVKQNPEMGDKRRLLVLQLDVIEADIIPLAFAEAKECFGRIDVVFNNAGYGAISEVEGIADTTARSLFEVRQFFGSDPCSPIIIRQVRERSMSRKKRSSTSAETTLSGV
ncbi:hypothetical protein C8R47DRAFT_746790 [Mycena vitilis]|nr:hypothetical protein C8R47DRAFT_746790 [Mycena vitilis]